MHDIVFYLRSMNKGDFRYVPRYYVSPDQAADEIEKLRAEINRLQTAIKRLTEEAACGI